MDVKGQKSIISEKSQKSRKKCQKSRFFEKFWFLWLLTLLRGITPLPVLDQKFFWKKWKKIQKSSCGDDFFQKVEKKAIFTPPTRKKCNKEHFNQDETKNFVSFSPIQARMQVFSNF